MEHNNSHSASDALIAFGMGLLAGVAVGMMLAPASGTETRQKLGRFAGKVKDRTVEGAEKASDFVKSQSHRFRGGHEEA
jgi:gas vesicle protein